MTCSEFLDRFSDFYDGEPSMGDGSAFRDHLDACASCRRYRDVVQTGVALLRDLPPPAPPEDFRDRLQHSIYSLEEERRRQRNSFGGSGLMVTIATAAVLAGVVLVPVLWSPAPEVLLSPIVVHEPPVREVRALPTGRTHGAPAASFREMDLWTQPNSLLYEHSPLFQRSRPGVVRTGLH